MAKAGRMGCGQNFFHFGKMAFKKDNWINKWTGSQNLYAYNTAESLLFCNTKKLQTKSVKNRTKQANAVQFYNLLL